MPQPIPQLTENDIHVWLASLDDPSLNPHAAMATLPAHEQDRARRFLRRDDVDRYVLARWIVRRLISVYVDIPVEEVALVCGAQGKPRVVVTPPLFFNWSHSGRWMAFAFTHLCEVGVDVEQLRVITDVDKLALRYFTPHEQRQVMNHPASERSEAFIRFWTRKEAYLKALGTGLTRLPDTFTVKQRQSGQWRVIDPTLDRCGSISVIQDLTIPQYAGAVAVRADHANIQIMSQGLRDESWMR